MYASPQIAVPAVSISAGVNHQVSELQDLALSARFAKALESGTVRYSVHRTFRFAARRNLEELFDDLALHLGWNAHRLSAATMILDAPGLFVFVEGGRKRDYCSCFFSVWAERPEMAEAARVAILARVGECKIEEPTMFSINWHFVTDKGELRSARMEEIADDVLLDEAYPEIKGGVNAFIQRYLDASEPVLVLQGPPGTGKTRMIRALLGEMSRRAGSQAQAVYTGDKKALENDEIFVRFITGGESVFVLEDAYHLLRPRSDGNCNLHRFLTIADGVVRSQGRKIVFSTNLPNIGDLDDALIRPGRCFARLVMRNLNADEAGKLLAKLSSQSIARPDAAVRTTKAAAQKTYSLAEVYRVLQVVE